MDDSKIEDKALNGVSPWEPSELILPLNNFQKRLYLAKLGEVTKLNGLCQKRLKVHRDINTVPRKFLALYVVFLLPSTSHG